MVERYPINLWINEERYEELRQAGLSHFTQDVLAGMRVLKIQCTEQEKDEILRHYPTAKFDSATTRSIELLPPEVKNRMFRTLLEEKSLDIVQEFLKDTRETKS